MKHLNIFDCYLGIHFVQMSFEFVNFDNFVKLTVHFSSVFGLGHVFGVFALNDVFNQKGRVLDLIEDLVLNACQ